MNLGELALTCFAYGATTYDDSLGQFERRVGGKTDLSREEHRQALLHWLNQWQCRQFSLAYHDLASAGLREWHVEFGDSLPPERDHLWEIPEATVEDYAGMFDALARKVACYRDSGRDPAEAPVAAVDGEASSAATTPETHATTAGAGAGAPTAARAQPAAATLGAMPLSRRTTVSFGPTAAAKILFVLRLKVFVAWDEPLRAALHHDGSGRSYGGFLLRLREELLELQEQCRAFDLDLTGLPAAIGRPLSTPAQLLGEYYWATLTRGVVPPSRQQVARWLAWYVSPEQPTLYGQPAAQAAAGAAAGRPLVAPPLDPIPEA